jgi:hypothetical protein
LAVNGGELGVGEGQGGDFIPVAGWRRACLRLASPVSLEKNAAPPLGPTRTAPPNGGPESICPAGLWRWGRAAGAVKKGRRHGCRGREIPSDGRHLC